MPRSYNYPAHNALREAWMRYLPPTLSQKNDHAFYLAGHENLELPGYLAKGLTSDRLHTAEHDEALQPLVEASSGGIQVVRGNVKDAIGEMVDSGVKTLRSVWLDFNGSPHSYVEELLALARLMPAKDGSSLGITSYAARDHGALIQGTVNAAKFYSGLPNTGRFITQYGRMMRQYEHTLRFLRAKKSTPLAHFQREMGLLWWLVLMFGAIDHGRANTWRINLEFVQNADEVLQAITQEVERRLGTRSSETDLVFVLDTRLRDLLARRKVKAWITHLERYAFWSANRQPMRTWFAKIQPWPSNRPLPTMQELLEQVWTLAINSPLVYIDEDGMSVTIQ